MPAFRAVPLLVALSVSAPCALVCAQDAPKGEPVAPRKAVLPLDPQKIKSADDLIAALRAAEGQVDQVTMRIETTGTTPDGRKFRTEGSMRVLGKTHFQVRTHWSFGDELEGVTETVRTPEGVWMHEDDPAQGPVYTHMGKDLMERVDAASRVVGDGPLGGPGEDEAAGPLGSRMLADLGAEFALRVEGPRKIDGMEVMVVSGARKPGAQDDLLAPDADNVDVLVRVEDGAVMRMTQLKDGQPITEVRVLEMDRKSKLAPESFVLAVPAEVSFLDVMAHPPAREQLTKLFADAKAKGWRDPAESEGGKDGSSTGTDEGKKR
ncbi:MAG: hypothetical protein U1F36_10855 [Planctomycetota bacterium]